MTPPLTKPATTAPLATAAANAPATPVPEPLVSTQWLADHLGAESLVVLDATVVLIGTPSGKARYLSGLDEHLIDGHIPGAIFAELFEVFSDPSGSFGFARPDDDLFAQGAASVGIDNNTTVVVYDSSLNQWAARIWWQFRAAGYDNVHVLDGGLTKWRTEGRETETGYNEPREVAGFTAAPRPELWVDKDFIASIVAGETDAALVCALPAKDYSGETGDRARRGHIPGSISIPAGRLIDRATNTFHRGEELTTRMAPVVGSARVVAYCSGGIASAASALALTLAGHDNVAIYDGSLNEWAADADAPLEVGAD
ncbi:sulfurtransferase [Cryobacterium frigoriphilum]|uniref:Sulfurtransferase n=1 Tax=Cryobacterium frigoriphilum TaxID=1259150 RepID=A0A4R9A0B7_9MICO|nr:rhodanese-like domain-containing protein [Cryobacterium frigoriphilum]TFD49849.1 sulfurtransferase [Cryobacterium frigoriphilum]